MKKLTGLQNNHWVVQELLVARLYDTSILEKTIKLAPDLAQAYYSLAQACAKSGKRDRALDYYKEALRLEPRYLLEEMPDWL